MRSQEGLPFQQHAWRRVALAIIVLLIGLSLVASLIAEGGSPSFDPVRFLQRYTQPTAFATELAVEYIKDPEEIKLLDELAALDPSDPDYEAKSRDLNQKIEDLRSKRRLK